MNSGISNARWEMEIGISSGRGGAAFGARLYRTVFHPETELHFILWPKVSVMCYLKLSCLKTAVIFSLAQKSEFHPLLLEIHHSYSTYAHKRALRKVEILVTLNFKNYAKKKQAL